MTSLPAIAELRLPLIDTPEEPASEGCGKLGPSPDTYACKWHAPSLIGLWAWHVSPPQQKQYYLATYLSGVRPTNMPTPVIRYVVKSTLVRGGSDEYHADGVLQGQGTKLIASIWVHS